MTLSVKTRLNCGFDRTNSATALVPLPPHPLHHIRQEVPSIDRCSLTFIRTSVMEREVTFALGDVQVTLVRREVYDSYHQKNNLSKEMQHTEQKIVHKRVSYPLVKTAPLIGGSENGTTFVVLTCQFFTETIVWRR